MWGKILIYKRGHGKGIHEKFQVLYGRVEFYILIYYQFEITNNHF